MTLKQKESMLTGMVIYVISGFLLYMTKGLPSDAALFPKACLILFMMLNTLMLISELRHKGNGSSEGGITWETSKMPLLVFLGITAYIVLFKYIGYFISTAVLMIVFMWLAKVRPWWKIISIVVGYSAFIYLMFVLWLRVSIV